MRTTLDLDAPVLRALKQLGKREKATLGSIASRLLADALRRRHEADRGQPPEKLSWFATDMRARVDLADKDALYRALDEAS